MKNLKLYFMVGLLSFFCSSLYSQTKQILTVREAGPTQEWPNAYNYLQDALADAQEGDEIWVAEGTYYPDEYELTTPPNLTDPREASFNLINGVSLYGGFYGNELTFGDRPLILLETILSGDIGNENDDSDNSYHILTAQEIQEESTLDGFVLKNGASTGDDLPYNLLNGSAIYLYNSSFDIKNCVIKNNHGISTIFCKSTYNEPYISSPRFINCTISNNYGIGLWMKYSNCFISDCIFENNSSNGVVLYNHPDYGIENYQIINSTFKNNNFDHNNNPNNSYGGAIQSDTENIGLIDNCNFENNKSDSGGGVLGNWHITNSIFKNNEASWSGGAFTGIGSFENCIFEDNSCNGRGGAIYMHTEHNSINDFYNCYIKECIFNRNISSSSGGAMYVSLDISGMELSISKTKFNSNIANNSGGAIYTNASLLPKTNSELKNNNNYFSFNMKNCILNNNSASTNGGALTMLFNSTFNKENSFKIINNTFFNNNATDGASISLSVNESQISNNSTISNCILWGNTDNSQIKSIIPNYNIPINYSCIKGDPSYQGTGNINQNPNLTTDFHLNPLSPCINTGTNSIPNLPLYDFEGDNRQIGSNVDMGADEARGIIYVDEFATGNNTGANWDHAFTSFQLALDIATEDHQIWVADGKYSPDSPAAKSYAEYQELCKIENKKPTYAEYLAYANDNTNNTFFIDKSLQIYGGFKGNPIGEISIDERNLDLYESVLTGDMDNDNNPNNNCKRVIYYSNGDGSSLDGFTIKEGGPFLNGAGIYVTQTSLNLRNCELSSNHISGANIRYGSNLSIDYCTFLNNINTTSGSPIYIHDSKAIINFCQFSGNTSQQGGAISCLDSYCNINHSVFDNNTSNTEGGAIRLDYDGIAKINFCTFANNIDNNNKTFVLGNTSSTVATLNIRNSIVWNTIRVDHIGGIGNIDIKYTDMQLSNNDPNVTYNNDNTNLNEDPEFVSNTDFHLNTTGKYEYLPPFHTWGCSPCIDTGDENEQCYEPNSDRVNMGRYGNTNEAAPPCSKSKKASETDLFISNTIEVNISPNPFSDQLNIIYNGQDGDFVEVSIFNLKGQMVYNKRINKETDIPAVINWNPKESNTPIPTGIYLVKLQNNHTSSITKVIYN